MWSLKFSVNNTDSVYTVLTGKFKVASYMYPVDFYKVKNKIHIMSIHVLEGEENEKAKFITALKNHKKTKKLEHYQNLLVILMVEEEDFYEMIYDPELYHPAPVLIKDGFELWNIASWKRPKLEKLIRKLEKEKIKLQNFKLLSLKPTNLAEIYFPKIYPDMPDQQQKAFHLALKKGYYSYPRKVDLKDLASEMEVSTSTFQEHLRKAEERLLPFFADNQKI